MASTAVNILKRTFSLAGATLASRVLGFVREILMAHVLGGGAVGSAWNFAIKLPNLARRIFGEGLLGTVLVPLLSQSIEKNGREDARQQFSTVFIWLTIILCVISTLVSGGSLIFLRFFAKEEHEILACRLIPVVMPYCIFICLIGTGTSALNSLKVFFLPACLSLLLNVCMIAALLWVCPMFTGQPFRMLSSLGGAVLFSGLLELVLLLLIARKYGMMPVVSRKNLLRFDVIREVGRLITPGLAGAGAYQLSVFVDGLLALRIGPYAVSALSVSDRLIYLPIGVFAVAFGTVSLPEMARMAQHRDYRTLIETQFSSMRYLLFLTVPLMSFFALFHEDLIKLFYFRGAFDETAVRESAWALLCYSCGIPAFAALKVTLTGFYSRKEMKTPMLVGIACNLLNLVLNLILMFPMRQGGLALSTAVCAYVNNIVLLVILNRQIGGVPLKETAWHFLLLAVLTLPGLYPAWRIYHWVNGLTGAARGFSLIPAMAAAVIVYAAVYLLFAVVLKLDEVKILTRRFRRKGA